MPRKPSSMVMLEKVKFLIMQQKRHYISDNVVVNWKLSLICLGYSYI